MLNQLNFLQIFPGRRTGLATWIAGILLLPAAISSCKKSSNTPAPDPFYAVTINGLTVNFQNKSTGATTYKWDFGDGASSTDANPVHTYAVKGKYVPTLYAISAGGVSKDASTVLYLAKGSGIRLDDNTVSDWDTVTHNVVVGGPQSGNFIRAKYDYDGNYVYVYFEQNTAKANGNIYDIYLDADNNPATGYLSNDMPGGGYEVLLEGSVFNNWLDLLYHSGSQTGFNFSPAGISDYYTMGSYTESGGVLKFEFGLKRSKIKNLTGQGLRVAVQVSKSDWSATIGYSPDLRSPSFFLDMSQ